MSSSPFTFSHGPVVAALRAAALSMCMRTHLLPLTTPEVTLKSMEQFLDDVYLFAVRDFFLSSRVASWHNN